MDEKGIKITDKIISIPPYLSTGWSSVDHIRAVGDRLVFTMKDGDSTSIPGFSPELTKQVFECHINYLESEHANNPKTPKKENMLNLRFLSGSDGMLMPPPDLLKMQMGSPDLVNMMQHNGDQKNMPDLPSDAIDKISKIIKIIAPSDPDMFPKPEPHCNCPYCQIARSVHDIQREPSIEALVVEEVVTEEELSFSQYIIEPTGEKFFQVTDKLFPAEKYTVFLGDPVGCTCGKSGCEHVIAVLKS